MTHHANRELSYPTIRVTPVSGQQEVVVKFMVPGSKFGPVTVTLSFADAQSLASDLIEATDG